MFCLFVCLFVCVLSGDAVNKIPIYGVTVISNPSVCDDFGFQVTVFGEIKLFALLLFLG